MTQYEADLDLLANRIILVTGAGDGIGAAISYAYAAHGATLVLLGRTQKKLENVYDKIVDAGFPQPAIYPMELTTARPEDYIILSETIKQEFGRLDGLLNNAAVLGTLTPIEHYDIRLWTHIMRINLTAPFLLTKECLPLLKKSDEASVIFTSANVGFKGQAYWGAYGVSKAASDNLMEILAEELEVNTNIRVNSVDPGQVRTRMHSLAYPGDIPLSVPVPEDITSIYLYLMGHESAGVTGERFSAQS